MSNEMSETLCSTTYLCYPKSPRWLLVIFVSLLFLAASPLWAQGTIRITLDTKPNSATDFTYSWTTPVPPLVVAVLDDDANATRSNTVLFSAVPAGSYTITQTTVPTARIVLRSIVCTGDTDNGSTVNLAARSVTIDLDNSENIVCTYSLWQLPNMRIQKRAYITNGTFDFTSTNVDNNLNLAGVQANASITTILPGVNIRFDASTAAGFQDSQILSFDSPVTLTELQNPAFAMLDSTPNCSFAGGTLSQTRTILNNGTTAGSFNLNSIVPGDAQSTIVNCVFYNGPLANLSVSVTDGVSTVNSGAQTTYTITAINNGPGVGNGAIVQSPIAVGLNCPAGPITCAASGGAVCPVSPTVAQLQAGLAIPTLPASGSVVFTITCNVTATGF